MRRKSFEPAPAAWHRCLAAQSSNLSEEEASESGHKMQFNVQNPVLSIGWSSTTTRALQTVTSASNGWLAAVTVDSELLTVAPSGESISSKGSGSTLCFSNSAENVVCASASSIDVRSMPDGQTVASLSELGTARADDTAGTGAGPGSRSRAPIVAKHPSQNTFAAAKGR